MPDSLAIQREAEKSTFARIMKPVREAAVEVADAEVVKLVEMARRQHHAKKHRK